MILTHSGAQYECAVAVKCENDKYIRLFDENGAEIASFYGISDFSEYTISNGSFTSPCSCDAPVALRAYALKGKTISKNSWILSGGKYYHQIEHDLISGNEKTCNIFLNFAKETKLEYSATQENGRITLYIDSLPSGDVVINSIQITKA